jgi:hypothetical protein
MLVAGAALAQQGLIVEPWRRAVAVAPAAAPAPATLTRALPSSGLPPASVALVAPRQGPATPGPIAKPLKWSPPVVELLVDPWARGPAAAPVARPARNWVPTSVDRAEIVDPWASATPRSAPLVARHPAGAPRSPIF